jgi:hypothetical protein
MGQIDDIASNIYVTEFNDEADASAITQKKTEIAAWLETNIGQLNILINTGFRIDSSNNVCPVLKDEEIAIFIQLYLKAFYKRTARVALKTASSSNSSSSSSGDPTLLTSDWTELREGDSVIKRTAQVASPQEQVKVANAYSAYSGEADVKAIELVHAYNMYRSSPRQVAGKDAGSSSTSECCTDTVCTPTSTAYMSAQGSSNIEAQ